MHNKFRVQNCTYVMARHPFPPMDLWPVAMVNSKPEETSSELVVFICLFCVSITRSHQFDQIISYDYSEASLTQVDPRTGGFPGDTLEKLSLLIFHVHDS